jgi:hypothetical protein
MRCARCNGIMAYDKVYSETEQAWGWRCIFCGEYVDDIVLENREFQKLYREKVGKRTEKSINRSHPDTSS